MNIVEAIRRKILQFLKIDHLEESPNSERYTFISDIDTVRQQQLDEERVWYLGNSDELLNYYTNQSWYGFSKEPAYNRNKANYFWGISPTENNIKRVHSGIPRAIVDTLTAIIGFPDITIDGQSAADLIEETGLKKIITQEQMPLTMVEGWGAFKIVCDPKYGKTPIIQYYEAKDVEFAVRCGKVIGIIFKDYYEYGKKSYVLLESRRINERGNSAIEYRLYKLEKDNEISEVSLSTIPELADLQDMEFEGYDQILAVPSRFFFDPSNKNYGRSIYAGKIDLFDDLDQSLSQRSQTSRVSTPVEYYNPEILERGPNGLPKMPSVYNRQFIQKSGVPDGNGVIDDSIQTTQPVLNFGQYNEEQRAILDFILIGLMSPCSFGIDVAKKDNAEAQREKEKVTIMTRNNIIEEETTIIRKLIRLTLDYWEYSETGKIEKKDREISVKFSEFASPTFENLSRTLVPMLSAGAISEELYVEKLYGDSMSDEEKQREVESIKQKRNMDELNLGDVENESVAEDMGGQEEEAGPAEI